MHLGEALMTREDAIERAANTVRGVLDRSARYYARLPDLKPDPDRPIADRIRADDVWVYVPFARAGAGEDPLIVRVNGVTKVCVVDHTF